MNTPSLTELVKERLTQIPEWNGQKRGGDTIVRPLAEVLMEDDVETPYLWGEVFPRGEYVGVVGKSGVNKSTFCRQLCLAVATQQKEFLGFALTPGYGTALYCFSEENLSWVRRYMRLQAKGMKLGIGSLYGLDLCDMNSFDTGNDFIEHFTKLLTGKKYDLVVLDSYSDFIVKFDAKLNDNDTIRKLKKQIDFLKDGGCTVLFNHHTSDKANAVGTFLGANAFRQIARAQLEIFADGKERILSCEKAQYGSSFEPIVCDLSEDFLFVPNGKSMSKAELYEKVTVREYASPTPVGRPTVAPCDEETVGMVFGSDGELTTGEIMDIMNEMYGLKRGAVFKWITNAKESGLIVQVGRGAFKVNSYTTPSSATEAKSETTKEIQYTMHPNYLDYIVD